MPVEPTDSADVPPASERKAWRSVGCTRCREPLYFPARGTSATRSPFLYCRKCGGRTPMPSTHRRVLQIAAILVFLAACTFVVLTFMREG